MRHRRRYSALGAAAIVIGFCGMAAAQALDSASPHSINPLSKLDPLSFEAFVQRPLFSPDRRVPEDTVPLTATVTESDTNSLDVRLLGVIVTPDAVVARIADEAGSKVYSLRQGEDFQDWTVIAIDSGGLKLSRNGEIRTFDVFSKISQTPNVKVAAKPGSAVDHPVAPETIHTAGEDNSQRTVTRVGSR